MASVLSTIVALTINPWISFNFAKDKVEKKSEKKENILKKITKKRPRLRKIYINFLEKFL
jgi:multidrug efflux pump subunit AcrB